MPIKRTTHRSSKGTKLYAVRDAKGRFKDIQTYKRAHAADEQDRNGGQGQENRVNELKTFSNPERSALDLEGAPSGFIFSSDSQPLLRSRANRPQDLAFCGISSLCPSRRSARLRRRANISPMRPRPANMIWLPT